MLDRRGFLGLGAGLTAAAGARVAVAAQPPAVVETAAAPRIRRHVTLGRTGLNVSDIGFGSSRLAEANLVRHALDLGVTYFDTAESYRGGSSEKAVGAGLKGVRDRVVLASKTKAGRREDRDDMMAALEGSLRRLRTDYLDIYFNHSVNNVARMQNEEWWAFTERAKEQGKIRFRGMSGHGSQLAACLDYAIDNDLVDVVLVAYNFGQDPDFYDQLRTTFHFVDMQPELPAALDKAKAKNVGVIAMKTLMGAKLNDMRPFETEGGTYAQAAFRWVLSSPRVDSLVVSMTTPDLIDEYVGASGTVARDDDLRLLRRYAAAHGPGYCAHGCNLCAAGCPAGVEIGEVLRTRMYDRDYGDSVLARHDYARIGRDAGPCLTCADQACLSACPKGIPIAEHTVEAARRLG